MVELEPTSSNAQQAVASPDDKRKKMAVSGAVIAVLAAAFALVKHIVKSRQLKEMETFVLKADNGTEAHVRPLGCCIQRTPSPPVLMPH